MMMPEVGSMPKVSGRRSATPEGGPTPGSAPISMPTITPATAIIRLKGVSATPKPMARLARKSIAENGHPENGDRPHFSHSGIECDCEKWGLSPFSEAERAHRKRHLEPVHEHEPVGRGGR